MLKTRFPKTFICTIVFVFGMGVSVLLEWYFKTVFLKSIFSEANTMNPATAVCFILSALSVLFLNFSSSKALYSIGRILCCFVGAIGFLKLGAYGFSWLNIGVDKFLFGA